MLQSFDKIIVGYPLSNVSHNLLERVNRALDTADLPSEVALTTAFLLLPPELSLIISFFYI